ncbi:MAG: phosphatase PAP2 family protein [Chitinophagaceae bacterium]
MKKNKLLQQLTLKTILIICLFICCIILFSYIADEAVYEREDVFDANIITFVTSHSTNALIKIMRVFTFFGSTKFLLPVYIIIVIYFLIKKKYRYSIAITTIALGGTALMQLFKLFFHRKRPELSLIKALKTYSFPSGHAFSSLIFCSILIYLLWQKNLAPIWKWLSATILFFFSLMIGISRIVLEAHFATDVIAGYCLAIAWLILSFWVLRNYINSNKKIMV